MKRIIPIAAIAMPAACTMPLHFHYHAASRTVAITQPRNRDEPPDWTTTQPADVLVVEPDDVQTPQEILDEIINRHGGLP